MGAVDLKNQKEVIRLEESQKLKDKTSLDGVHTVLSAVGSLARYGNVPEPTKTSIYTCKSKWEHTKMAALCVSPVLGNLAKGGKLINSKFGKIINIGDDILRWLKGIGNLKKTKEEVKGKIEVGGILAEKLKKQKTLEQIKNYFKKKKLEEQGLTVGMINEETGVLSLYKLNGGFYGSAIPGNLTQKTYGNVDSNGNREITIWVGRVQFKAHISKTGAIIVNKKIMDKFLKAIDSGSQFYYDQAKNNATVTMYNFTKKETTRVVGVSVDKNGNINLNELLKNFGMGDFIANGTNVNEMRIMPPAKYKMQGISYAEHEKCIKEFIEMDKIFGKAGNIDVNEVVRVYLIRSLNVAAKGEGTDDVTALGLALQILISFTPLDKAASIRDIVYLLANYKDTSEYRLKLGIAILGLLTSYGAFKYADDVINWLKNAFKKAKKIFFEKGEIVIVTAEGAKVSLKASEKADDLVIKGGKEAVEGITHNFQAPGKRHYFSKINKSSPPKDLNTIIDPSVNVELDVKAINAGNAKKVGNDYVINGRTYGVTSNGELFPKTGTGFYQLNRGEYKALKLLKQFGNTERGMEILKLNQFDNATINKAIEVYEQINKNLR